MSRRNKMLSATLALAVSVTVGGAATSALAAKSADATAARGLTPIAGLHKKVASPAGGLVYVVQLRGSGVGSYDGSISGLAAPERNKGGRVDFQSKAARTYASMLRAKQGQVMASVGARPIYNYVNGMNGFAAQMTPDQVSALKRNPDVITIWKDDIRHPQTDNSRAYIGLSDPGGLHGDGVRAFGEDIVIGVIDSGVWPENPSFSNMGCTDGDSDPVNDPLNQATDCATPVDVYGGPPSQWTRELNEEGTCDFGNTGFDPTDVAFECNGKLLAARKYSDTYELVLGPLAQGDDYDSARDIDGHGSHTTSTAGGNANVPADVDGMGVVNISGMAPRARLATYKVCFVEGCFGSDTAAAIDDAIADGVDVLNYSVGGASTSFSGADDAAFLFAMDAGIFVATSNGNAGPNPETTGTPSGVPWITSVGAMQDSGVFGDGVWWTNPGELSPGRHSALEGGGPVRQTDLGLYNANMAISDDIANFTGCAPWNNTATGLIALVGRGACSFQDKYDNAAAAGAVAILIFNDRGGLSGMSVPTGTIPGLMILQDEGTEAYLAIYGSGPDAAAADSNIEFHDSANINATIDPTLQESKDATMAGFSSRGPNGGMPDVIKPDVSAPGVTIGAALAPGVVWGSISGTSMASPHVAGLAAGLIQVHQGTENGGGAAPASDSPQATNRSQRVWKPSWFKSAMMTTARNGIRNDALDGVHEGEISTPFDVGAGQIVSGERANGNSRHPGIVYPNTLVDHQRALCGEPRQAGLIDPLFCASLEASGVSTDPSDLNLASIGIAQLVGTQTVHRHVECTGPGNDVRTWDVKVKQPPGITVEVNPPTISCAKRGTAEFDVTFTINENTVFEEWAFGRLSWVADDGAFVRSPLAIFPVKLATAMEVHGVGTDGSATFPIAFGYDGTYMATMGGLVAGTANVGAVADGDANQEAFIVPAGTVLASFEMSDEDVGDGSGSTDLDLQVFGPDTAGFPFVGSSGGPTSNEVVLLENPAPGTYVVLVIDFASAPGPTPYTLFNFNGDGTDSGNTVLTAPAAAAVGIDSVTVDWAALDADMLYKGIITHSDGIDDLALTVVTVDTR